MRNSDFNYSKKLVLIGGGGHCKSVLDSVFRMGVYQDIVITDLEIPVRTSIMGCSVVGDDSLLPKLFANGYKKAIITVGSIKTTKPRENIYNKIKRIGFKLETIIDPSAQVSEYAKIGNGTFVGKNACINSEAIIGDNAIINTNAVIEHDCKVGDFSHISVNAVLCGESRVGDYSFIGANSTVIQGVTVGSRSVIGAGTIVIDNIGDNIMMYNNVHKNIVRGDCPKTRT